MLPTLRPRVVVPLLALALIVPGASARQAAERGAPNWLLPLPELQIDPKIPTLEKVVGHAWARDISSHAQIEKYLEALAAAAPDRAVLAPYGKTFEGRTLYTLTISSPDNIRRLEEIRETNLALADPRRTPAERAKEIARKAPGVVWLSYAVHGDETSSSDAALLTAYHLLADQREVTRKLLEQVVVIIDPLQNPDGRDRFIAAHREARGVFPQAEPLASERTQRWARGRLNHYLFDMNRDWANQTQAETKAKVQSVLRWQPHVLVDAHEMGFNSNYYFDPPTDPINPYITDEQNRWYTNIGRAHADRFDTYGFAYTTRELFDAFFPGYGSTWPTLHGAIGILWEQAGVRGLVVDREDDKQLTYPDAVRHHYISGLATLDAVATGREALLVDFHKTRSAPFAMAEQGPVSDYFLLANPATGRADRLAQLLIDNGIEIYRTTAETKLKPVVDSKPATDAVTIPAGSYHIPVAQPAGRLVRALLDRNLSMGDAFIKRQLDRKARRLADEIYDITAWSFPLTHGVDCVATKLAKPESAPPAEPVEAVTPRGGVTGPERPRVGYLVPGDHEATTRALPRWLREGLRVHVIDQPTTIGGREFPRGSLLLRNSDNPDTLHASIRKSASELGLDILAVDSAFVDKGAHLGGPYVTWVKPPRVLMAVDDPASAFAGHTWYFFDQVWNYPVTRVNTRLITRGVDLEEYDVLILPDGSYGPSSGMGEDAARRISDWIRRGGTLILVDGALSWAATPEIKLVATRPKRKKARPNAGEGLEPIKPAADKAAEAKADADKPKTSDKDEKKSDADDDSVEAEEDPKPKPPTESPDPVPGAFFRAQVSPDHWATFGQPSEIVLFLQSNLILRPVPPTEGRNLVTILPTKAPESGFCWPDTVELLGQTPYAIAQELGDGHIIGFTSDPNFRAVSPVGSRLFWNAVFHGPGH